MNNYIKKIILIIGTFFLFILSTNASTTSRAYINSSCNIRSGAGTQYSIISSARNTGAYYNLVVDKTFSDTNNHYGCNGDWYQIYYNGIDTGYVCSDHVSIVTSYSTDDVAPTTACEIEMNNLGFPSSYWGGLCNLKEKFPKWNFVAAQTNLDWSTSVSNESACGKSYTTTINSNFIDNTCSNPYTNTWYPASSTAVAYYMDPRNFLSEKYIFQFNYLKYDSNLANSYINAITNIISGTSFYSYHGSTLPTVINTAGSNTDVNPIFLASRILQELGSSTAEYDLYSGIYTGYGNLYYGYYNFFNYGVNDACVVAEGRAYCGLSYAYSMGWNSPLNAISGAANLLSSSYISVGQHTAYFQKYNVVPIDSTKLYLHQYMTNIAAPFSESATTYNSYSSQNILNEAFTFYIPVYQNMSATIDNTGSGATGNESSNGLSTLPISTIVTSSGYSYTTGYISGIELGSDVATVKSNIESIAGPSSVFITDASGTALTSGIIATGYKISISNASTNEILEVVIKGDTSGDGKINALDLLQIQKSILNTYTLSGSALKAGDTSGDGKVNALDLLQVQKNILGTYTIVQ